MARPTTLSMTAGKWNILYSIAMPSHPTQSDKGWQITIPQDTGELDYVLCSHNQSVENKSLQLSVTINCDPQVVFDYKTEPTNTCIYPAHVRLLLYRGMQNEFDRWWSAPSAIMLAPGTGTITVPFAPSQWVSVYGKRGDADAGALAGFTRAVKAPTKLGMTFGGGCFYGHGVRTRNGPAVFTCNNCAVV